MIKISKEKNVFFQRNSMNGQEISEAELELLTQKLSNITQVKLRDLNPTEISSISYNIPKMKTMLEYRSQRDDFLLQFNDARLPPHPKTFTEELLSQSLKNPDLSKENQKSLRAFFISDIERSKNVRSIIERRFNKAEAIAENYQYLVQIMKSLTDHIYKCESGLERLQTTMVSTFSLEDIILQISANYAKNLRESLFNGLKDRIRGFPISSRASIINRIFTSVTEKLSEDSKKDYVYFLPKTNEEIDKHLTRLSKRFDVKVDINEADGQKFLYIADKIYADIWKFLGTEEREKDITIEHPKMFYPLDYEIQQKLIEDVTPDVKLSQLMEQVFTFSKEEAIASIKETVRFYKSSIPDCKLVAFMQLRFIHMKFLAKGILSTLNYFTLIKSGQSYKIRANSRFPCLIDVVDESGLPFVFTKTKTWLEQIKLFLLRVCTHYLSRYEQSNEEPSDSIDKEGMLESLLEHMFNYLNAVRSVIQPLIEAYEHSGDKNLLEEVYKIIDSRPKLALHLYRSFDTPFELAVELMRKRGDTLRFLVNAQILHERQVSKQLDSNIPLFDRPAVLPAVCAVKTFPESVAISQFEVYESLSGICKFISIIHSVAKEFAESLYIKGTKFFDYVELAIWHQFNEMVKADQEIFPYDKCTTTFNFLLSDSVNSLFNSPFVNRISEFKTISENMNEGRKLRFYLALKHFIHLTGQLEDEIIRTNMLQTAYFESCDWLNISDRSVLLPSFNQNAKQDVMEIHQSSSSEKVIDFAYSEFAPVNINFCSTSDVKDFLLSCDFTLLIRLVQFQRLQNTILETAVHYNNALIDSDRIVQFFDFNENTADVFLTTADNQSPNDDSDKFMKQFIAPVLLYNSTTLYRDNQLALADKLSFMVSIASIKNRTRTLLSAQTRQKEYSSEELFNLYRTEMLDAFSSSAYRYEIARITTLERQLLLDNSFIDVFVLGPKQDVIFLNEAGRFESFFYVPTWVECFQMMQTAPSSRQSSTLKSVLDFVLWRYMILNISRFDCAIDLDNMVLYKQLFNSKFQMETAYFQKLANEFTRLPNSREVEIASQYLLDKYTNYFYRMEHTILAAIDNFYKSVKVDTSRNEEDEKKEEPFVTINNPKFGEILKDIWFKFHCEIKADSRLILKDRYTPSWMETFLVDAKDGDRIEFRNLVEDTDSFIEESINEIKGTSVMEYFQILPAATNLLKDGITQFHLKYAYYLLIAQIPEEEITFETSITKINHQAVLNGATAWNDVIMMEVNKNFIHLDEPINKFTPVSTAKQIQATFDVVRNNIDLFILANQIKHVQQQIEQLNHGLSGTTAKNVLSLKPNLSETNISIIAPEVAAKQFDEELKYSTAKLTNFVFDALDATTLERKNHDGTFSTIYDADVFEAKAEKISFALSIFGSGSVEDMSSTWSDYISSLVTLVNKNREEAEVLDFIERIVNARLGLYVATDSSILFEKQFHEINALRKKYAELSEGQAKKELAIREEIKVEFDDLVNDLGHEIVKRKSQFGGIKKNVLDNVIKKINDARNVQLEMDKMQRVDSNYSTSKVRGIDIENTELKRKIKILRIIRCFGNIATKRVFAKKILSAESDRKQANSVLYSNKLLYEENGEMLETQLKEAHRKLAFLEIDIEKLKQQLDNEKMSNIQLVHWKAKNEHRADDLKKELSQFNEDSEVNIDELLEKISAKQQELDELREDNKAMEEEIEKSIRAPSREAAKLRDSIRRINISKNEIFERVQSSMTSPLQSADIHKRDYAAQLLSEENIKLRHENELLKNKIEKLKAEKDTKGVDEQKIMASTIKPKSQLARATSKLATIKKPTIQPNRAISKL